MVFIAALLMEGFVGKCLSGFLTLLDPGKRVFLSFARGDFGRADPGYRYFSPFARGVFWFLTLANAFIYRLPGVFSGEATLAIDTFRHLPGVFATS